MAYLFTSESVTEGHPDKVCDRVSDSILDAILAQDKNAHVACETTATTGRVNIMGEVSTTADVDFEAVARKAIREIGYDNPAAGFDGNTCEVNVFLDRQSPDIAMGVDASYELKVGEKAAENQLGAGDQGMMFGYARHGGGAFSGKDPTKVDRSAAYFARYIAKNIVAAGLAKKAEVQLAYAIGVAKPVSVMVETFGTSKYTNEQLAQAVNTRSLNNLDREALGVLTEEEDEERCRNRRQDETNSRVQQLHLTEHSEKRNHR